MTRRETEGNDVKFKAGVQDVGCWIDGTWGRYGSTVLIHRAWDCGMTREADALAVVAAYNDGRLESTQTAGSEFVDLLAEIDGLADAAEAWLNEQLAPERHSFGWFQGEFFLWADEEWEFTR